MRSRAARVLAVVASLICGAAAGLPAPSAGAARTTAKRAPRPTTTVPASASWRVRSLSAQGLAEVSGCAVSRRDPGLVWLHNDGVDGATVVPVDLRSWRIGERLTLTGIDVVDPEDIAITAAGDLVLADIGDNARQRASIQLYRFPEPSPGVTAVDVQRFDLRYPDGPHDAEAMVVSSDGRWALIFTKQTGRSGAYRADLGRRDAPDPGSEQVLEAIGAVAITGEVLLQPNLVTAADAVGSSIVLRTYWSGYLLAARAGEPIEAAVRARPRRFSVPPMVQSEAICASADGRTLVTASESRGAATFTIAVGPMPR